MPVEHLLSTIWKKTSGYIYIERDRGTEGKRENLSFLLLLLKIPIKTHQECEWCLRMEYSPASLLSSFLLFSPITVRRLLPKWASFPLLLSVSDVFPHKLLRSSEVSWFFPPEVGCLLNWVFSLFLDLEANASEMVPLVEQGKMEMVVLNETRRKLGSFQICALCTCCGGARGVCLPSPCCYAINCNIPNRPFGFCSFTPKTCNCFGCHIWDLVIVLF